jgi:hypothetical protein
MSKTTSLLDKIVESSKKDIVEETVPITINKIVGTSNPLRMCMKCVEGDFFCFVNTFPNGVVPAINKPIKAEMVLREKGEYVNVVSVTFDMEQLGKFNLVSTYKNPVIL